METFSSFFKIYSEHFKVLYSSVFKNFGFGRIPLLDYLDSVFQRRIF